MGVAGGGIDHPLAMVRDLAAARARCEAIGFTMTPIGEHPWGTGTSLAVFAGCLLELMGVVDESKLDRLAAGSFRFGRTVAGQLAEREGISLVALHSEDLEADARVVADRGIDVAGRIWFGRDVMLPDGRTERTATALLILFDPALPRLSHFLCQQHRRDLVEVPRWMEHPNGAVGIGAVGVLARREDWKRVRARFAGLYGAAAIEDGPDGMPDGMTVRTPNGRFVVGDAAAMAARYGALPDAVVGQEPCCISVHVRVRSLAVARACVEAARVPMVRADATAVVLPAAFLGNTFLVLEA